MIVLVSRREGMNSGPRAALKGTVVKETGSSLNVMLDWNVQDDEARQRR